MKTDEVQLILVSAVILMPGACVFPKQREEAALLPLLLPPLPLLVMLVVADDVNPVTKGNQRQTRAESYSGVDGDHPRCGWRTSVRL